MESEEQDRLIHLIDVVQEVQRIMGDLGVGEVELPRREPGLLALSINHYSVEWMAVDYIRMTFCVRAEDFLWLVSRGRLGPEQLLCGVLGAVFGTRSEALSVAKRGDPRYLAELKKLGFLQDSPPRLTKEGAPVERRWRIRNNTVLVQGFALRKATRWASGLSMSEREGWRFDD